MNQRTQILATLVREGIYAVDEHAVAEAILLRGAIRRKLPGITFASEAKPKARSFRRAEHSLSFRLADERRRTPQH